MVYVVVWDRIRRCEWPGRRGLEREPLASQERSHLLNLVAGFPVRFICEDSQDRSISDEQ